MGWSFVNACSAIVDLSVRPFLHASRCSFSLVPSLRPVSPMYTWPQVQGTYFIHDLRLFLDGEGVFYLGEEASEGWGRPEHRCDVKVVPY